MQLHNAADPFPQGSPLSPILYISYNAGLIEQCSTGDSTAVVDFRDNLAILAWGHNNAGLPQALSIMLGDALGDQCDRDCLTLQTHYLLVPSKARDLVCA